MSEHYELHHEGGGLASPFSFSHGIAALNHGKRLMREVGCKLVVKKVQTVETREHWRSCIL